MSAPLMGGERRTLGQLAMGDDAGTCVALAQQVDRRAGMKIALLCARAPPPARTPYCWTRRSTRPGNAGESVSGSSMPPPQKAALLGPVQTRCPVQELRMAGSSSIQSRMAFS